MIDYAHALRCWRAARAAVVSGGELIVVRTDEYARLQELADKYKWQVRDTCARAEKAEVRAETPQSIPSERDAIVAWLDDHLKAGACLSLSWIIDAIKAGEHTAPAVSQEDRR